MSEGRPRTGRIRQAVAGIAVVAAAGLLLWLGGDALALTREAMIALLVLVGACVLFFTELIPLGISALLIPVVLCLTGVLTEAEAFASLCDDTILMFAGMFVVGQAMFATGVAHRVGSWIAQWAGGRPLILILGMGMVTVVLSSVLSNTGTVAVLLPICLGVAESSGVSKKWLLFTLANASGLGGMITMAGTPPNATVHSVLVQAGETGFGFVEFAWIGIPVSLVGLLFLISPMCRKLLQVPFQAALTPTSGEELSRISMASREQEHSAGQQLLSVAVLIGVVVIMATGWIPLGLAAVAGALLCVIVGLLSAKEAVEAIDWSTIFLFAGTLALAEALEITGVGHLIAELVVALCGGEINYYLLITVLFLFCGLITQFMSNTAACALLAPIGLQIAQGLGVAPKSVLIVVAAAACSSYLTPMATPPNTLVFGCGGFRFQDFLKAGMPLFLLTYLLCILIVPAVWPIREKRGWVKEFQEQTRRYLPFEKKRKEKNHAAIQFLRRLKRNGPDRTRTAAGLSAGSVQAAQKGGFRHPEQVRVLIPAPVPVF